MILRKVIMLLPAYILAIVLEISGKGEWNGNPLTWWVFDDGLLSRFGFVKELVIKHFMVQATLLATS
jgi:hypothetical protein